MHPLRAVGRETADGNHAVEVGMVQQILPPRVEHAEETNRCAEVFGVGGDLEERRRARVEEQVVHDGLVLECEP